MKKLVIACQTCGYLMRDMIKAYSEEGYAVTLMASRKSKNSMMAELPNDVRYRTVMAYDRSSTRKRLLTWGICTIQMWWKILVHHRGEEVLYVSNPPFSPLLPLLLRNRFSLLIWDIYPDVLVSQKVFGRESSVVKWWRGKNTKVFGRAERVFTISDGMKKCLSQYVDERKIRVVPLWPNGRMKHIRKEENQFLKEQCLEGKFVVLYSGNLGNTHRVEVLLDVAQIVEDNDIEFVLVGGGGKKKMIEERIEKEKIQNVRLLPYQPIDKLPHSLSAADVAVVTLDTASSQMSVPSKTFNLLAVGAPLMCIASKDSELGKLVRRYNVGESFMPEDIRSMAQYIIHMKADKAARQRLSKNAITASKDFTSENARMFIRNE